MQKDMFEAKRYWYDLVSDIANVGIDRNTLNVGDTFTHKGLREDGHTLYRIVEKENCNQMWLIEEVKS